MLNIFINIILIAIGIAWLVMGLIAGISAYAKWCDERENEVDKST